MIRRLRLKFIAVAATVLLILFALQIFTLNVFMRMNSTHQTNRMMKMVADTDGVPDYFRKPMEPGFTFEHPFEEADERMRAGRFFYVKVDDEGAIIQSWSDMMYELGDEDITTYVHNVMRSEKRIGSSGDYQYLIADKPYGQMVVFAERSVENFMLSELLSMSTIVAGIGCIILMIFVYFLSNWAVQPVAAAFEKQRRFISDASHELKTPVTIISANVDMLENEIGANTWLTHIKNQSQRMAGLIHDLLTLAKTDETETPMTAFNLSRMVSNTALEFESTVFEDGKTLVSNIEPDIHCYGDEHGLKQVTEILIDNALKHSDPGSAIDICLNRTGSKAKLSVANACQELEEAELERIFERFYRSDVSRSRETGGYGLGLSIARSIIKRHKGKISATAEGGNIRFVVLLDLHRPRAGG